MILDKLTGETKVSTPESKEQLRKMVASVEAKNMGTVHENIENKVQRVARAQIAQTLRLVADRVEELSGVPPAELLEYVLDAYGWSAKIGYADHGIIINHFRNVEATKGDPEQQE